MMVHKDDVDVVGNRVAIRFDSVGTVVPIYQYLSRGEILKCLAIYIYISYIFETLSIRVSHILWQFSFTGFSER